MKTRKNLGNQAFPSDPPSLNMKLFDAASRLLPTMFVVSLTPEGTLYQHANQRLTTVVYMLDEHREKLTNLEMMSHKADYRRLKGVADVIEETLKGVSLEGGRALSKKDLKTIVTSFFLEAESFHKRVTITSREATFRSLPNFSVESVIEGTRDKQETALLFADVGFSDDSQEGAARPALLLNTRNLSAEDIFNTMSAWDVALRTRGILSDAQPNSSSGSSTS